MEINREVGTTQTRNETRCDITKVTEATSKGVQFDTYAHHEINRFMLRDPKAMLMFKTAIVGNKHLFRGKVVLDVGCGTGVLSMFAAQAGAAKVIGVDCSNIINHTRNTVVNNNFGNVITLVKGRMEDVLLPDGIDKVDIIVSQWMGYALFYERMLHTVIDARDKWLKPGGLIFPDRALLFVAGIESEEFLSDKIEFWKNVYGFKMETLRKPSITEANVEDVTPDRLVTNSCLIKDIDLYGAKEQDLKFTAPFHLQCEKDGLIHALVLYFDVEFTACFTRTGFSTCPVTLPTHWLQTTLYFDDKELIVKKGEQIQGSFKMEPIISKKKDMNIIVEMNFDGDLSEMEELMNFTLFKV